MKRGIGVLARQRNGQITVFIIAGLLILFVFLFLIFLSSSIIKKNLQGEQEKVFTTILQKEGLQLYVQDCLTDETVNVLGLLGRQGRLWREQNPGGFLPFSDQVGVYDATGIPVFYGIRDTTHAQYPNAYPCKDETNNPEFCQYEYPNISLDFGRFVFSRQSVEEDIARFIRNQTVHCVEDFITTNISQAAQLTTTTIDATVSLTDEGIVAQIEYPLHFSIGQEEFQTISTFDFFYPTPLGRLLDVVVDLPLRRDRDFLDFSYTEETLLAGLYEYAKDTSGITCVKAAKDTSDKEYFTCTATIAPDYQTLQIDMTIEQTESGDTIFHFISPDAQYSIARQNRPPALDYVSRLACPAAGYDYLAIKDDLSLEKINLSLFALDPDEQTVSFSFDAPIELLSSATIDENEFITSIDQITPGWYNITALAQDPHGKKDWQIVRMLIDNAIIPLLSLNHAYSDVPLQQENVYFVSPEDPIQLSVSLPEQSLSNDLEEVHLYYEEGSSQTNFALLPDRNTQPITENNFVFQLPFSQPLLSQEELLYSVEDTKNFQYHPFSTPNSKGQLVFEYGINYCGLYNQTASAKLNIAVRECIPHRNTDGHVFPAPFASFVDEDGDFIADSTEELADPFQASHACCIGDSAAPEVWSIADDSTVCFQQPDDTPGCYGRIDPESTGYLLEVSTIKQRFCSGTRGNLCNGAWDVVTESIPLPRCGDPILEQCQAIDTVCRGEQTWHFSLEEKAWCNGDLGCGSRQANGATKACRSAVVDTTGGIYLPAFQSQYTEPTFACGCTSEYEGNSCRVIASGEFGTCQDNTCVIQPQEVGKGI